MEEIEVIVDAEGNTSIDLTGFHGKGCESVSEELAKALGIKVSHKKKCEFYEQEIKPKQKVAYGG